MTSKPKMMCTSVIDQEENAKEYNFHVLGDDMYVSGGLSLVARGEELAYEPGVVYSLTLTPDAITGGELLPAEGESLACDAGESAPEAATTAPDAEEPASGTAEG